MAGARKPAAQASGASASDVEGAPFRDRQSVRQVLVVVALLLALLVVAGGGTLLHAQSAAPRAVSSAVVGRTSAVCTVPPPAGSASASPTPSPTPGGGVASTVSAVAIRGAEGQGSLTGSVLTGADAAAAGEEDLTVTQPGGGASLAQVPAPLVLTGEGVLASSGSGVVSSTATTGEAAGLMAAPCLVPGVEQWLVGVGASEEDRTELVLTNPDDAQAEVDLRFYGPQGRVVVPGSPGVLVGARSSRTLSLSSLVESPGPLSVAVRSSAGRVAVAARRLRSVDLSPVGADWQVPSVSPATSVVVPGVPGGSGTRSLELVNPGTERTQVFVEVLGLTGAFAPADADTVDLGPESTATVQLATGLAGESAGIRVRSETPVTAAVVSSSTRTGAAADLAVQSAMPSLVRRGVSAVATTPGGPASELVLTNAGDTDTPVTFEVISYAGVSLRRDDILLAAGGSATRRLISPGPSYVVVGVPDGSAVVGSVTLTSPEGPVAGLATIPLTSPDVASRAPRVEQDPAVAR